MYGLPSNFSLTLLIRSSSLPLLAANKDKISASAAKDCRQNERIIVKIEYLKNNIICHFLKE